MYIENREWEQMRSQLEELQKENKMLKKELLSLKEEMNRFPKNPSLKGRPRISPELMGKAVLLREKKKTIREIAADLEISTGSVSNMLKRIETYRSCYTKLTFMNRSTRCTEIYVDFKDEEVYIVNYTEDILYRAFGCNENPTWQDFLDFLESRCFPKTRDKMKWILRELELPCYDPLLIIEKTKGRMAEDHQWIAIG